MHIGVMGAGAIGCYLGGLLADRGYRVTLVGRERVCGEVSTLGLVLTTLGQRRSRHVSPQQFTITNDPERLAHADVVLVATKSAQTPQAGAQLRAVLPPHTLVVSTQNGMRNAEVLRAALPAHQVLTAIVGFNIRSLGDGHFRQSTTGPLVFEATQHPQLLEIASVLEECGVEAQLRSNIRALQWAKLVMNLNNAISALSGAPTPQLLFNARYRSIVRAVMHEALGVLSLAKIQPGKLGAVPVQMFPLMLALPTLLLRLVLRAQLRVDPEARSSMWEDLVRGRTTEVDELNGAIVQLASQHGGDAPLNRRIVLVMHEIEARRAGSPTLSPDKLQELLGLA